MAEVTLEQVPRKTREVFEKAASALERGNFDYAMDMFASLLEVEPRLLQARKLLRAAQIKKFRESGSASSTRHLMASLGGLGGLVGAQMAIKTKPHKALAMAEKLMRKDPLNPSFYRLLARAAEAADMPETAIHTLEFALEAAPEDVSLLRWLGNLYKQTGDTAKARECFDRVFRMKPNDPRAIKDVKDAQAMDTMKQGKWTEAQSYRDVIKDQEEAKRLEKQAKAVATETDVEELIAEHLKKIEAEPQNINYRRALADLYARADRFDEALAALAVATEITGGGDPQVDRAITGIRVRQYDVRIEGLRAAGKEAEAEAVEQEKTAFIYSDAEERVKRYPNDLQFKYEYGVLLFDRGQINEAVQQFQLAQRNPQRRIRALYYLARCFEQKGQYDIAAEQLEKAVLELSTMDNNKKDVLYELGLVHEKMGQQEKANDFFKQIYAVDISYKDVASRIEKSYKR